jgi:hypothetical protein
LFEFTTTQISARAIRSCWKRMMVRFILRSLRHFAPIQKWAHHAQLAGSAVHSQGIQTDTPTIIFDTIGSRIGGVCGELNAFISHVKSV